jgi:hypothetical protein
LAPQRSTLPTRAFGNGAGEIVDIYDFSDLEIDGSNVTNGFFGRR